MNLILCYEAKKQSNSDKIYIKCFLEYYYPGLKRKIKITWVSLGSKSNFGSVEKQIEKCKSDYSYSHPGDQQYVVFCLDSDNGKQASSINNKIKVYCSSKDYQIVWFNRDIEEAMIGKQLENGENKKRRAIAFEKRLEIKKIHEKYLSISNILQSRNAGSNIKLIFDKILLKGKLRS